MTSTMSANAGTSPLELVSQAGYAAAAATAKFARAMGYLFYAVVPFHPDAHVATGTVSGTGKSYS